MGLPASIHCVSSDVCACVRVCDEEDDEGNSSSSGADNDCCASHDD